MSISMHSASVPIFVRMLTNVAAWLDKASAYAQAKQFDVSVLLGSRLYPDMLPLTSQVQIVCDTAKFCVARLAAGEAPKFDDTAKSIEELKSRIARTIDYLQSVPAAQVDGSEARAVNVPRRGKEPLQFTGEAYLKHFALPNFFFHATTAYAILRHNGVEVGKADYIGRQPT
jgi:uncharacterized protein